MSAVRAEKWVRTLERSLHMLSDTQRWGWMAPSESDRCVLSYPLQMHMDVSTSHSCPLSSIIDVAQYLTLTFTVAVAHRKLGMGTETPRRDQDAHHVSENWCLIFYQSLF